MLKVQNSQICVPFLDTIQCGDSAKLLTQIPDNSIDLIITSPPYFQQREYAGCKVGNERRVESYIDNVMDVFHQCVRITKDSGSIVFNMGDKYIQSSLLLVPYRFAIHAMNVENIKLVNNITWVKTNPTPRQYKKRLVNSTEPFFHFVKTDDYYYNLDNFQYTKQTKPKSVKNTTSGNRYRKLIQESNLTQVEKNNALKSLEMTIKELKQNKITGFRMKIRGIHAPPYGGQEGGRQIQLRKYGFTIIKMYGNKLKKDSIINNVETLKWNKHPAIYPESIITEIIKLLTPNDAIVLDPYIGSGTTAVSAKRLGRKFIGIDITPEYCYMAKKRVSTVKNDE